MTDNINIEKPLPIKTYNVSKVNEKLKRLENAIEQVTSADIVAGTGIEITESNNVKTITNTAPGEIYTAGSGIEITSENVINNTAQGLDETEVKALINGGWKIIETDDWTTLVTDGVLNQDIIIVCKTGAYSGTDFKYVPKGYPSSLFFSVCNYDVFTGVETAENIINAHASLSINQLVSYPTNPSYLILMGINIRVMYNDNIVHINGHNSAWRPTKEYGATADISKNNIISVMVRA